MLLNAVTEFIGIHAILGTLMNTRGLVELPVLNIGLDLGVITPRLFTMLVIMALVTTTKTGTRNTTVSGPDFHDWREQSRSFETLAYWNGGETSVSVNNASDYAWVLRVTPGYFRVFGVTARAGRLFTTDEEQPGGPPVVVITDAYWRRQFGADPRAVGSTVTFDQQAHTIVGVTAPEFRHPARADIYSAEPSMPAGTSRSAHNYRAVGRLAAAVTLSQAQSEMTGIAARLSKEYPVSNGDKGVAVVPMQEMIVGDTRQTLFVLLAAVGFVLLIACANVANLLLARASARGRELVVRAAVGAGRMRLVRQMLTESIVLALLAGAGGILIARWGVTALLALAPPDLPRLDEVTVDLPALAFALAASLLASVIFGLAPAWHVSRVDLADGLRQGGKGWALGVKGGWARKAFVVTEIALALVMGAGLLGRSLIALANVDMGFKGDRLVVLRTAVPVSGRPDLPRAIAAYRALLTELRARPGVAAAGAVTSLPTLVRSNGGYWIEGGPGPEVLGMKSPQALFNVATPDYFRTLQVPVSRGRDFNDGDRIDAPFVALINEQLAKDAFPGVDPIGRSIRCGLDTLEPMTIVGIVKDVRTRGPGRPVQAEIYMPYEQHQGPATSLNIVMRSDTADPLALGATAARHIRERNPDVPVRIETMETTMAGATAAPRFRTVLLVTFAVVALLLAIAGVYGVMAYTVSQRVPEIGLRVALGASPGDVMGLVLKDGGLLIALGLVAGAALSFAGSRFLTGLLFGVSARDPLVFVGISLLVAIAALAACLIPGRRALRVDPLLALRAE